MRSVGPRSSIEGGFLVHTVLGKKVSCERRTLEAEQVPARLIVASMASMLFTYSAIETTSLNCRWCHAVHLAEYNSNARHQLAGGSRN